MQAKHVMTSPVITVTPDTPVPDIAALLLQRRISGVPVTEADGRLVGIVTEGDLLHRAETGTERRRSRWLEIFTGGRGQATDYVKSHGTRAADVMTRHVITVGPDTELTDIASLMERERVKRVPVSDDGRVVGIVSRANLLHGLVAYRTPQPRTTGDAAIRETLLGRLGDEAWIDVNHVNIVVNDGVVHLWGVVDNDDQRHALRVAAESVPGVRGIEEHLHRNRFVE
ncbi:CBS domain-containing protein [Azospirillum halopraeferens]|uniref:CBS domain-containing protein n=1 Tax=Azospirillum halopraeferens TaxID=34010 RepID=UPI000412A3C7|nr:CBS domain-containing protein [Azospirillum halopraeferens]